MKKRVEKVVKVVKEKAAGNVEDEFSKIAGKMKEAEGIQSQPCLTSPVSNDKCYLRRPWCRCRSLAYFVIFRLLNS